MKTQFPKNRILGYRVLVQMLDEPALADSWLWIPEEKRHKFHAARIIQVGKFRVDKRRPPTELKRNDCVLVDTTWGSQNIKDGERMLRIVSIDDVAALIEHT